MHSYKIIIVKTKINLFKARSTENIYKVPSLSGLNFVVGIRPVIVYAIVFVYVKLSTVGKKIKRNGIFVDDRYTFIRENNVSNLRLSRKTIVSSKCFGGVESYKTCYFKCHNYCSPPNMNGQRYEVIYGLLVRALILLRSVFFCFHSYITTSPTHKILKLFCQF